MLHGTGTGQTEISHSFSQESLKFHIAAGDPYAVRVRRRLLGKSSFPLLNVWMSAMKEDEAVKGYLLDPETHLKFLTLYTEKKFTYDF